MFKVKSVSIRPKEGTEHAHSATSSNSTYLATFHRPGLSLSSNEKFVLLLITMLQNDPKLEAKTITTSLCPTILLTKNLSRAQLGGFSVLHEVSGGRSVAISWRMNGLAWRVPVSDPYLYDWRLGSHGWEGWFHLGVLAEMRAHGLCTWQPPESQSSRTVARDNWRSHSQVQGMSLPSS